MTAFEKAVQIARDNAPYLADSLELFPDIVSCLEHTAPEEVFSDLCAELPEALQDLNTEMSALRQFKRRAHLVIALSDIAGVWGWVQVTEHLSRIADLAMKRLLRAVAIEAGFAVEGTVSDNNPVPGLFIVAMGKYGARELNYSSDIDFNVFYDPDIIRVPDPARAERLLIRLTQSLVKGFESITKDGYIFRTDLRLRPDPRSNAIIVSTHTAERYYETLGQNWERAAMIKARICAGDERAGQDFVEIVLSPFIWRRSLDYAAIEDIHSIKRQMQSVKGLAGFDVAGHHVKLGPGGIREIEFFAQVQQLILGGRHPELRQKRTVDAIAALSDFGVVEPDISDMLIRHYGTLRKLEHCAQMMRDEQTHHVPEDRQARESFSKLAGYDSLPVFENELKQLLHDVHTTYNDLFPEAQSLSSEQGNLVFTGVEPEQPTLQTLTKLGFSDGSHIWRQMAEWLGGRIPATRSERARELLTRLAPQVLDMCAKTGQADKAFAAFAQFFTRLRSGVTLLSMFAQKPENLERIIRLMLASPRINDMLATRPQSLDAMIEPDFQRFDHTIITENYAKRRFEKLDFEDTLNAIRRQVKEDHFRICAGVLGGSLDNSMIPFTLTEIAEGAVARVLEAAAQVPAQDGQPLKGQYAVLGLGKFGGRELSLSSDLDIMLVYQADDDAPDIHTQFTRLTRRLVSGLSVQTAEGGLFDVDMALRPSGRSGPVAVSLDSFSSYYAKDAWTWEFMALSRARVITASSPEFAGLLRQHLLTALTVPRPDLDFEEDIKDMLARTKREKKPTSDWDIKEQNGGLRDIEYIAQSFYLRDPKAFAQVDAVSTKTMLGFAREQTYLSDEDCKTLQQACVFYMQAQQVFSLLSSKSIAHITTEHLATFLEIMEYETEAELIAERNRFYDDITRLSRKFVGVL